MAQALARDLQLSYVDSGAMYRAVTLYAIHIGLNEINFGDIVDQLNEIDIKCKWTPQGNKIYLNNIDITNPVSYTHLDVYKRQPRIVPGYFQKRI